MKDKNLLVRVGCTSRPFYLKRPREGRNDFMIRFWPPKVRGQRSATRGVVNRSLGTMNLAAAKARARVIIESYWNDAGRGAVALKLRNDFATIGELLSIYEGRARQRPVTVRSNASSLRLVVRTVHGGDADAHSTSVLTAQLVRDFEAKRLAGMEDEARQRHVQRTISSYLKQARSVVALRKMKFYAELRLPDLAEFRSETVDAPKRSMPRPLDLNGMRAMEAARPAVAQADPGVYVTNLMFSHWGLRNIEITCVRRWWFNGAESLGIIDRPEENFFPKGCEGWIDIDGAVLREILRFQNLCVDGYLVPGASAKERHDAVYRRHSRWVSKWIKDRTKTSYELRRYAGSRILDLNNGDIFMVRDFLRHRDVQTTQNWYAYRLGNRRMKTIGMENLVPATEVA